MKFLFLFIQLNFSLSVYSQNLTITPKKDTVHFVGIKVRIENFILKPASCGVMKFISVYKASFIQPNYIFKNKEILIFVTCREAYGMGYSPNKLYYVDFALFNPELSSGEIVNYSGINLDSAKGFQKAKIYNVRPILKKEN